MSVEVVVETLTEPQILHLEQSISLRLGIRGAAELEYHPDFMLLVPITGFPYVATRAGQLHRFKYASAKDKPEAIAQAKSLFQSLLEASNA